MAGEFHINTKLWWNDSDSGNRQIKACRSANSSTTNPTKTGLGSNKIVKTEYGSH